MSTLPISHVHASYSYTKLIAKKQPNHTPCSNNVEASSSVNHVIAQQNGNQVSTTSSVLKRREFVFGTGACFSCVLDFVYRQNALATEVAASPCELTVAPSGLAYCDKVVGTGPEPAKGQLIKAHYVGKLENGTVFDSSYNRGKPLTFRIGVGEVIRGWDIGIMGGDGVSPMLAGGKRRIMIPPELGYGVRGAGCRGGSCIIPPNSVLLFDVEFIGKA